MILKTREGGNVRVQASTAEWGTEAWIPLPGAARLSEAGVPVTESAAFGLPAVASVIRSAADILASMPFCTYRGEYSNRQTARDTWQWDLFHNNPDPTSDLDSFQFWYDLVVSIEAAQNGFVLKSPMVDSETGQQKLGHVNVIDPQRVQIHFDNVTGEKLFNVYVSPTDVRRDLTMDDILHVRGFSRRPGVSNGTSFLEIHRDPIGSYIAMQKYEGDFFRNNGLPPFWFTGAKSKQHAQDLLDGHNASHRGVGNQWKAGALWGEVDVKSLPLSVETAMFVQAKNMSIEDVCRMWRWPRQLVEIGEQREPNVDYNILDAHLMKFYILPRLKRIESAFAADPDVYYGTDLYGEFLTQGLERADTHTRYDAYRLARQGGWVTANELRQYENLPLHPDGDELQQTPVGGAPNQAHALPPGEQPSARAIAMNAAMEVLLTLRANANGDAHMYDARIEAIEAALSEAEG